jgi:hypothetical protein
MARTYKKPGVNDNMIGWARDIKKSLDLGLSHHWEVPACSLDALVRAITGILLRHAKLHDNERSEELIAKVRKALWPKLQS